MRPSHPRRSGGGRRLASAVAMSLAALAAAIAPASVPADELDGLPAWLLGPYPEDGRLYAPGVALEAAELAEAEIEARAMAEALLAFQAGAKVNVFARATADSLARTGTPTEETSKDSALVQVTGTLPAEANVEVVKRWTSGRRIAVLLAVRNANGSGGRPATFFLRSTGEVTRGRAAERSESLEFASERTTRLGAAARSVVADLGVALAERAFRRRARVDAFTRATQDSISRAGGGEDTVQKVQAVWQAVTEEDAVRFRIVGLALEQRARRALRLRLAPEGREVPARSATDDDWESFAVGPCPGGAAQGVLCAVGVYEGPGLELGALMASATARCALAPVLAARAASGAPAGRRDAGAVSDLAQNVVQLQLEGTRVVRSRRDDATGKVWVLVAAPAEAVARPAEGAFR